MAFGAPKTALLLLVAALAVLCANAALKDKDVDQCINDVKRKESACPSLANHPCTKSLKHSAGVNVQKLKEVAQCVAKVNCPRAYRYGQSLGECLINKLNPSFWSGIHW